MLNVLQMKLNSKVVFYANTYFDIIFKYVERHRHNKFELTIVQKYIIKCYNCSLNT